MGLCGDAPKYPKKQMDEQLAVSKELGERYLALSEEQQGWAKDQWDQQYTLMKDVLGTQTAISQEQWDNAKADRQRYQDTFQPLEDDLIAEFRDYDSPERRTLESGRAQAGVQQALDSQRRNAAANLEAYGIDPSQTRAQAIDMEARTAGAAQQAAQGNQARNRVEDVGRSLRADAINIGKGMPSQAAQAYGQALQGGNSAIGNANSTVASGANTMGTGGSWGGMGSNQVGQSMSGINNMYSGQLAGYNAGGAGMGALGNLASTALGGYIGAGGKFGMGGEEGGEVPGDLKAPGPTDTVPTMLAPGEFVIPEHVVRRKGTEFFDKLQDNVEKDEAERAQVKAEGAVQQAVAL